MVARGESINAYLRSIFFSKDTLIEINIGGIRAIRICV